MERRDTFTRRIRINTTINEVFDAWTVQGEMEKWFLKSAIFSRNSQSLPPGQKVETGDTFEWIWHTWPEMTQKGSVLNVEENKTFQFEFLPAGIVTIGFEKIDDQVSEFALTQNDIPSEGKAWYDFFYGCSLGWSFWMVNLKAFLEHGIVLDQKEIFYSGEKHLEVVNQ